MTRGLAAAFGKYLFQALIINYYCPSYKKPLSKQIPITRDCYLCLSKNLLWVRQKDAPKKSKLPSGYSYPVFMPACLRPGCQRLSRHLILLSTMSKLWPTLFATLLPTAGGSLHHQFTLTEVVAHIYATGHMLLSWSLLGGDIEPTLSHPKRDIITFEWNLCEKTYLRSSPRISPHVRWWKLQCALSHKVQWPIQLRIP